MQSKSAKRMFSKQLFGRVHEKLWNIARSWKRKKKVSIEHTPEDIYQTMWVGILTLVDVLSHPEEIQDDDYVREGLRYAMNTLKPPRRWVRDDSRGEMIIEEPWDTEVVFGISKSLNFESWKKKHIFDGELFDVLPLPQYRAFKMMSLEKNVWGTTQESRQRHYGGYTKQDVATAIGVHYNTITNWIAQWKESERFQKLFRYVLSLPSHVEPPKKPKWKYQGLLGPTGKPWLGGQYLYNYRKGKGLNGCVIVEHVDESGQGVNTA